MRAVVFGPGDIKKHIELLKKYGKVRSEKEYWNHVDVIVEKVFKKLGKEKELILSPDRGLPFEVVKKAKEKFGSNIKVLAAAPMDDKEFGIRHLQPQLGAIVDIAGQKAKVKVFDRIINTRTWRDHHFVIGLLGEAILYLGHTTGTIYEIGNAYYLYKLICGKKDKVKIEPIALHPEVRAHLSKKFITYFYEPFIIDPFPRDLIFYVRGMGGDIIKL